MSAEGRAQVRFDKYAILEVSRVCGLTGPEQHLLWFLTLQASWRTAEWEGTFQDVAQESGVGRHQVSKILGRLVEVGVLDEVRSFGRGRAGRVFIAVYDEITVSASRSKQITRRRTLDPEWRTYGLGMASVWPDRSMPAPSDLGERESPKEQGNKEEGTDTCTAHGRECCMEAECEALEIERARAIEIDLGARTIEIVAEAVA